MSSAFAANAAPLRRAERLPFDIAYPNSLDYVFYAGMHLVCLAAFWTGVTWNDAGLCAVLYVTRMFGLTAGYHRYFAHRSFRTSRAVQFLLGLLGTLAVQKGVLWWASTHRHHHRYSDTELDLHSPVQRSFLYSHSGWFLDKANRSTDLSKVPDLARYPELVWLNRWDLLPIALFAWLIELGFGWRGLVWGFFISTILIWHAIHAIGSFGHRFGGYRRFATADNSRNKWFLAIALLGEGWHNNHHFFPGSARSGFAWWEYDVTYWLLKAMERLGLVWDVRIPPRGVRETSDPAGHVRAFEQSLMDLRLTIGRRIEDEAAANDAKTREQLRLLRQAAEMRLDVFHHDVLEQILLDPARLRPTGAELRRDIAAAVNDGGVAAALAAILDAEIVTAVRGWSIGHLILPAEVRSAH
jgi:stearoyl-CoA desaturase (delta-9 desaturase)